MHNAKFLTAALVLTGLSTLSAVGQQQEARATAPTSTVSELTVPDLPGAQAEEQKSASARSSNAPAVEVTSTANAPEVENAKLRPVAGQLETALDSAKAKPGDPVAVKTTENATTAEGLVIPKGSRITGHVTDVQAHESGDENGKVTLQFDKAELKNGKALPIQSVLEAVAPPVAGGSRTSGGKAESGKTAKSSEARGGGASAAATVASLPGAGTVVAKQGNTEIKTTSLPGVLMAASRNGEPFTNAAGALLKAKDNVKLADGTQMVLAVAEVPARNMR